MELVGIGNFFTWNTEPNAMRRFDPISHSLLVELWLYTKIHSPVACPPTFYMPALIGWNKLYLLALIGWKNASTFTFLRRVIWVGVVRILRKHCPEVRYHRFL